MKRYETKGRNADTTRTPAAKNNRLAATSFPPITSLTTPTDLQQVSFELAVHQGILSSKGCAEHLHNQELEANRLLGFVHDRLGIQTWAEFRNIHVKQYVGHLTERNMTPSSIRNATNVIRLASGWMLDNFDHPPVTVQRYLPKRYEPTKVLLSPDQVKQAYHMAHMLKRPQTACMVLLCGCCALRLTEAMRLEPEDLRDDDVLYVGLHGSKNPTSVRALPIPAFVARELRACFRQCGLFGPSRYAVSHQIREVFDAALADTGDETFKACAPKYLRRSLANLLAGKVDKDLCRAYYGHSQQDMFSRFYASMIPKVDDVPSVQRVAIDRLRDSVVKQIDRAFRDLRK